MEKEQVYFEVALSHILRKWFGYYNLHSQKFSKNHPTKHILNSFSFFSIG